MFHFLGRGIRDHRPPAGPCKRPADAGRAGVPVRRNQDAAQYVRQSSRQEQQTDQAARETGVGRAGIRHWRRAVTRQRFRRHQRVAGPGDHYFHRHGDPVASCARHPARPARRDGEYARLFLPQAALRRVRSLGNLPCRLDNDRTAHRFLLRRGSFLLPAMDVALSAVLRVAAEHAAPSPNFSAAASTCF